ncbi:LysE family translocator [Halodesulfovibrio aestuarii]|uniref:LysE family translocator n=1 Tax=Halodesulfovibrio aestuarii TaxID=126333 RepID=UPI00040DB551
MLTYDITHWSSFFAAALLLNISPGPDFAFILSQTVKGGKKAGVAAMVGIWTGAFGHVLLAALGVSAIVMASANAFAVIKWVGAAYLLWLGFNALRSKGTGFQIDNDGTAENIFSIYRQGILIDLLNPKVATFFIAFLPQFIVDGAGPVWMQLLLHGTLLIATAALVEPPLIFIGDRLTTQLRSSQKLRVWLDRVLGSVLVGLGVKLALSER